MLAQVVPTVQDDSVDDGRFSQFDLQTLSDLHDLTIDAASGYATMVEKAEPGFRTTAARFHALHTQQAGELARLLSDIGGTVNIDGTLMGTVNKAVVTVRSWFDDIDADVMDQVRRGEDHILSAFDAALASHLPDGHRAALGDMRDAVTGLLADTAHLN